MDRNDLDLEDGRNRAAAAAVVFEPALPAAGTEIPTTPGDAAAGAAGPVSGTLRPNSAIVFIDAALAEHAPHIAGCGVATVVLTAGRDGIDEIADHLAAYRYPQLATVGIVAPGAAGAITVGESTLSLDTVGRFAKPLAEIGAALQPGGRLLFQAPGMAGDLGASRALLGQIAGAAGIRVGAATADGSDSGAAGAAFDPQIWAAVNGLSPNILVHADSSNGSASNSGTATFASGLNLLHVGDFTFAPANNLFFIIEDNGSGDEKILSGTLSQAVSGSITALTTLFSDTITSDGLTDVLGIDPLHQQIYFVDGQLNSSGETTLSYFERMSFSGSSRTTLATFQGTLPSGSGGGIPGMALDLAHSKAYFAWEEGGSISSTRIFGGTDRLYMASGVNSGASSVTLTQLPLLNFPSSTAFIESLAIDPINQVLYFTTGYSGEANAGGVFAYNLVGNSSGTFSTVFSQAGLSHNASTPWGDPRWIEVDPISGKYYISVVQFTTAGDQSGIFVGNLSDRGVTPSLFLSTSSVTGAAPEGLALDYFPTVTPGHSTGFYTEGAATVIDSALALTDPLTNTSLTPGGTLDLSHATVVIGGFQIGDTLTATTIGTSISVSGGTNGTLTLSGVDTLAHYQSVLESVGFSTTVDTGSATRTITFTVSDGLLSGTATETIAPAAEAPSFGGTTNFSGSDEGTITLSGVTVSKNDTDDALGASITVSGVLPGWSVVDPGVTTIAGSSSSSGAVATTDIGKLVVIAPDAGVAATDSLTLVATSSEGSSTATAMETLVVTATAGPAEAPTFGGTTNFSGSDEGTITLSGLTVSHNDSDDTLGASITVSGVLPGWSVVDPGVTTIAGSSSSSGTVATTDIGKLVVIAPDAGVAATDSLTLVATSSEGSSTATTMETLVVTATAGPAEAPTLSVSDTTMAAGSSSSQAPLTISVTASDPDDTLGLVTISGLLAGFSLNEGTNQGGGSWTEAVSDLPSLQIVAPAGDSATMLTLGVTASASEGGQSATAATTLQVDIVPCYRRGTLILTEAGEVAVEDLKIGDKVVTLSGEARPIRWIGRRAYEGRFIAGKRDVLPIRIAAGALADGVPARDLWLSPGHSLYIDGVLAQSEHLINGATITQAESVDAVEYFHIELDTHDILFADGTPAESYLDCDNRLVFANAAEYARLYPEDERPHWAFCVPKLGWGAAELTPIRAALLARAEVLGHRLDRDPDLHLVVDGAVIRADTAGADVYRFCVPAGSRDIQLASRTIAPVEVDPSSRDTRRLGVAVESLALSDDQLSIHAAHGHPALREGFWQDEEAWRWTKGLALLPEAWLVPFTGGFTLQVRLAGAWLLYRRDPWDTTAAQPAPAQPRRQVG